MMLVSVAALVEAESKVINIQEETTTTQQHSRKTHDDICGVNISEKIVGYMR